MKRALSLFLCLSLLFLVSCGNAKNVKATYNEKSQLVADNGVTYNYAPGGYQPTNQVTTGRSYFSATGAAPAKATYLELNKGDMVQHTAFGQGMVLSVMKMGGDALLEIAFDRVGTKKLMAKTASSHMKKL